MVKDVFNELTTDKFLADKARMLFNEVPVADFIEAGIGYPRTEAEAVHYAKTVDWKTFELIQNRRKRETVMERRIGSI